MRRLMPVVLWAAGLLVLLEIVGALASRPLGFPYPTLGAVSLLIYATVGLLGALRAGFVPGVLGAGLVGLVDGSLGPLGAWFVGPGPLSVTINEPRVFAYRIAVVTAAAMAAGVLGALAGGWVERRRAFRNGSRAVSR
ncbi:MAG TPA: hypothetical protein VHH32_12010 [Gemmatimonadales bacterium]|nr:hypothetical protein [Gemmatimonadales bacterium]